ncbi:major facilitator superfamily domain-containing protein [Flagelloscypha sp. PMI_526]|nr:major facilitator superfamily domain-containing protein [Flagelloscypha sp. PMI_526]
MAGQLGDDDIIHDENSPLLGQESPDGNAKPVRQKLPAFQLAVVFLIQFSEPITAIVIYSFVNQFVRSTGITGGREDRTGYFAGIIESVFFWAEGITALPWQLASDRFGRRPVMLLAPLGLGVSMILFGISTNFWYLVVFRAFQVCFIFCASVGKHLERGFRGCSMEMWVSVKLSLLSPFIGGVFTSPEEHWPNSLGKIELFKTHPYFLPCLISGCICLFTFALAIFGLKETSPIILRRQARKAQLSGSVTPSEDGTITPIEAETAENHDEDAKVTLQSVMTRPVALTVAVNGFLALTTMFYNTLQPLVWSTSIEHGGLGFDAFTIGSVNWIFGLPNAIVQFLFLGKFIKLAGPRMIMNVCFIMTFIMLLLFPIQTYLARASGEVDWKVWVCIGGQLCCYTMISSAFGAIMFFAIEASPNPAAMGTYPGGVAPALASSLFAFSQEENVLGGMFVYLVLGIIDLIAIRISYMLPYISA